MASSILFITLQDVFVSAARRGDYASSSELKEMADVFDRHDVKVKPSVTEPDVACSNELYVTASLAVCEAIMRDVKGCKAIKKTEIFG